MKRWFWFCSTVQSFNGQIKSCPWREAFAKYSPKAWTCSTTSKGFSKLYSQSSSCTLYETGFVGKKKKVKCKWKVKCHNASTEEQKISCWWTNVCAFPLHLVHINLMMILMQPFWSIPCPSRMNHMRMRLVQETEEIYVYKAISIYLYLYICHLLSHMPPRYCLYMPK